MYTAIHFIMLYRKRYQTLKDLLHSSDIFLIIKVHLMS